MEDLLRPRHPLAHYHQAQVRLLTSLPESQRADQARLLRLGNAAYRYQQLAEGHLTEADYQDWLAGLAPALRRVAEQAGFEQSKPVLGLRRHALDRRDLGYDAFMQATISAEDWAYELALRQSGAAAS